jgi:hypothetical protein
MRTCSANGCGRRQLPFLPSRAVGVTVDGDWYCSSACVEGIARERLLALEPPTGVRVPDDGLRMRVGGWLRHIGAITDDQLAQALDAQRTSGLRMGAQVIALNFVSAERVLKALSLQAGVPYLTRIDLARVGRAPGNLSRHAVRALSVVPFAEPSRGFVKVACLAPLPRLALSAFRRITGFVPEPHLIGDHLWAGLVDAYGSDVNEASVPSFVQTHTLADAAATIARTATTGRAARLTGLRCDDYTWMRVMVPEGAHDVVYAQSSMSREL